MKIADECLALGRNFDPRWSNKHGFDSRKELAMMIDQ